MAARGGIFVQGEVLERTHRSGTTNGREWAFESLAVLTGATTTEVTWQNDTEGGIQSCPNEGDNVNLAVSIRNGRISVKRHAAPLSVAKTG